MLAAPLSTNAQEIVSADAGGTPVPRGVISERFETEFTPLDVSEDGRYVLLANFTRGNTGFASFNLGVDSNCNIYRKDRESGELLTVFESAQGVVNYCNTAKMSADGNIVVTSPSAAPENTQGELVTDRFGRGAYEFSVLALVVANIDSGSYENIWTKTQPVSTGRLPTQGQMSVFGGFPLHSVSADGTTALLTYLGPDIDGLYTTLAAPFRLVDLTSGTVLDEILYGLPVNTLDYGFQLSGYSLSGDGNTLAVGLTIGERYWATTGPGFPIFCGRVGRCESQPDGLTDEELIENFEPPVWEDRVYLWHADSNVFTEVADLRKERVFRLADADEFGSDFRYRYFGGGLPPARVVQADSLSVDGNTFTWVESPTPPSYSCLYGGNTLFARAECPGEEPCLDETLCELRVVSYSFNSRQFRERYTEPRADTKLSLAPSAQLSNNGRKLLYPRVVVYPFGGDFTISGNFTFDYNYSDPAYNDRFLCISRASVDSGSGIPVTEECKPGGPVPILIEPAECNGGFLDSYACYSGPDVFAIGPTAGLGYPRYIVEDRFAVELQTPVTWYVLNLITGKEIQVAAPDGNMFQADNAIFSDDGRTVAFKSRDPRLRDDLLEGNSLDETMLPDGCFWPNGPDEPNLRVVTNDNTKFYTSETQYVYQNMPEPCLAPTPEVDVQVFATDVLPRSSAGSTSSSSFGWLVLPLLGLAALRRRRLH